MPEPPSDFLALIPGNRFWEAPLFHALFSYGAYERGRMLPFL